MHRIASLVVPSTSSVSEHSGYSPNWHSSSAFHEIHLSDCSAISWPSLHSTQHLLIVSSASWFLPSIAPLQHPMASLLPITMVLSSAFQRQTILQCLVMDLGCLGLLVEPQRLRYPMEVPFSYWVYWQHHCKFSLFLPSKEYSTYLPQQWVWVVSS